MGATQGRHSCRVTVSSSCYCWAPGVSSPVHAHSDAVSGIKSSCHMLILEGSLCETTYDQSQMIEPAAVAANGGKSRLLGTGGYAYIDDTIGVHKVGNASSAARALSLHICSRSARSNPLRLMDRVHERQPDVPQSDRLRL